MVLITYSVKCVCLKPLVPAENRVPNFFMSLSTPLFCSSLNCMLGNASLPVLDLQSSSQANHSGKALKSSPSSLSIKLSKSLLTGLLHLTSRVVLLNCTTPITSPSLYCTHHNALESNSTINSNVTMEELGYILNSLVLMSHSIPLLRNSPVTSMW